MKMNEKQKNSWKWYAALSDQTFLNTSLVTVESIESTRNVSSSFLNSLTTQANWTNLQLLLFSRFVVRHRRIHVLLAVEKVISSCCNVIPSC